MSTTEAPASSPASIATPAPPAKPPEKQSLVLSQLATYFIAGGCAGAASRTVVSPLERLKIIQQVQPRTGGTPYKGVYRSLARMWKEEGFKGFMRGNGINCVRIIPYSAVQFTSYETLKKLFSRDGQKPLDTPTRLLAGALAGICSVSATYPLDLTRARLSIVSATMLTSSLTAPASHSPAPATRSAVATVTSTARSTLAAVSRPSASITSVSMSTVAHNVLNSKQKTPGMWGMMMLIYTTEGGLRALYKGIVPTTVGVAPYVGINFAAYEWLRQIITPPGKEHHAWQKLSCGALAGSMSQTLTYPFDVLRRKMQVSGLKTLGHGYDNAFDAIRVMYKAEGLHAFYRGLWPNLLKVAPSIATSFYVYELAKGHLQSL